MKLLSIGRRDRALGQEVMKSLSPGQVFLKIVQSELEAVVGPCQDEATLVEKAEALARGLQMARMAETNTTKIL